MAENNTGTSPSGDHANVGSSGEPRGANLIDLGHTGPKSEGDTLTTDEQHREMSQHEYRGQDDEADASDIVSERLGPTDGGS